MQNYPHKMYEVDEGNGDKEMTYVFDVQTEHPLKETVPKFKTEVWQIFPSVCASLTSIPFGLMLGWPSPIYPKLLAQDTPLPITMNQTAMVAGFLMFGVSFGTMASTKQIGSGPKYGIILGNLLTMLGWLIMWQAQDIYGLLGSRILLGAGQGYAMGQIKSYIIEMTEDALSDALITQRNFYGLFGFVLAFAMGPFVDFRQYSFICLIISVLILFIAIFLPSTPRELIRTENIQSARKLLIFLKPDLNPEKEMFDIYKKMGEKVEANGFMKIMRNPCLRSRFIKLTVILFCQQYCGAPPTIVYTQILFTKSNVPGPAYFALGYAVLFFFSSIIGTYVSPRYNKKIVLLCSCFSILILYVSKILVIYFKVNEEYFQYSSVIVMYFFIIAHTVGLGSIPFMLIPDWFPKGYSVFVTKYFIVLFCIFALTNTKLFQVLIGMYPLYIPFCLFTAIIVFAIVFISIFVPYYATTTESEISEKN